MPMPCEKHPKAMIDEKVGCMACWFRAEEVSDGDEFRVDLLNENRCQTCFEPFTPNKGTVPKKIYCSVKCGKKMYARTHDRREYYRDWKRKKKVKDGGVAVKPYRPRVRGDGNHIRALSGKNLSSRNSVAPGQEIGL